MHGFTRGIRPNKREEDRKWNPPTGILNRELRPDEKCQVERWIGEKVAGG